MYRPRRRSNEQQHQGQAHNQHAYDHRHEVRADFHDAGFGELLCEIDYSCAEGSVKYSDDYVPVFPEEQNYSTSFLKIRDIDL